MQELNFLSVAPKNVADLLDSVTQCTLVDFRTDVKIDIRRSSDKCVEANMRNTVGLLDFRIVYFMTNKLDYIIKFCV